jgi:N-methylhydantoinase A
MTEAITEYYAGLGLSGDLHLQHALDMRFVGQAFEVTVDIAADSLQGMTGQSLGALFDEAHHRVFEFGASPNSRAEIVSFRLGASVPVESMPSFRESETALPSVSEITVFDRGEHITCRLITRAAFRDEGQLAGPALVEDTTSTIYLPPGWTGRIDEHDNLIIGAISGDA